MARISFKGLALNLRHNVLICELGTQEKGLPVEKSRNRDKAWVEETEGLILQIANCVNLRKFIVFSCTLTSLSVVSWVR